MGRALHDAACDGLAEIETPTPPHGHAFKAKPHKGASRDAELDVVDLVIDRVISKMPEGSGEVAHKVRSKLMEGKLVEAVPKIGPKSVDRRGVGTEGVGGQIQLAEGAGRAQ